MDNLSEKSTLLLNIRSNISIRTNKFMVYLLFGNIYFQNY